MEYFIGFIAFCWLMENVIGPWCEYKLWELMREAELQKISSNKLDKGES